MITQNNATQSILPAERKRRIVQILRQDGKLHAGDLAGVLGTSEDTVRRDLRELEAAGLLDRVRGGALPRSAVPLSHEGRRTRTLASKEAIGWKAAATIGTTDTVLLDGGTTTLEVARFLSPSFRGTVVTNNLPAAVLLAEHPGAEVVLLGGRLFKPALDVIGATLARELRHMRADVCFVGAASLDPEQGLGSLDYEEVQAKRILVGAARRVVAVLSGEKLGTSSPFIFAELAEVAQIVTDEGASEDVRRLCEKHGVEVLVAK